MFEGVAAVRLLSAALIGLIAGCSNPAGGGATPLVDAMSEPDWQALHGAEAAEAFERIAENRLTKLTRTEAIEDLRAAGFECIFGEAHPDYPDPAAQCTRSFATRACQMDWEIFSTAEQGRVADVDASFTRDCVGTDRDWPEPKESAIDDQLAPPRLP